MNRNGLRAAAAAAALVGGLVTAGSASAAPTGTEAPAACVAPQPARINSQQLELHLARAIVLESAHPVHPDTVCCVGGASFPDN